MGTLGTLTDYFNGGAFALNQFDQTPVEFETNDVTTGWGLLVYGAGFTYSAVAPITGTIRAITFKSLNSLLTVSELTLTATDLMAKLNAPGHSILNVLTLINGGNDSVSGTDFSDNMTTLAGAGRDTIHGNGGADLIMGGGGNDRIYGDLGNDMLTGNGGADGFVFATGFGVDTISDFHNTGHAKTDDQVWITRAMHHGLTMTETTDSVTHITTTHLNFTSGDQIDLTNWHVADVGASFFHYYV